MKRKGCSPHDSLLSLFDDDELEVSEILLQIPGIIFQSENRNRSLLTWGVKKRRSAIDPELSPPSVPSSSSPYLLRNCVGPTCDDDDQIENAEACSPVTPLSFSSSESKRSKTSVSYEMKEDLLKMVEELTHRKELLKTKIESIERFYFYNMLIALNSELKAKKQQLSLCIETETAETRVESRDEVHSQPPPPLPLPLHHSAFGSEMCGQTSALVPSAAGSGVANFMGPPAIPDLIVSPEETLGPDLSRRQISTHSSQCQARKKRLICRVKKPKGLPQTNQYLKLGVTVTNMVV